MCTLSVLPRALRELAVAPHDRAHLAVTSSDDAPRAWGAAYGCTQVERVPDERSTTERRALPRLRWRFALDIMRHCCCSSAEVHRRGPASPLRRRRATCGAWRKGGVRAAGGRSSSLVRALAPPTPVEHDRPAALVRPQKNARGGVCARRPRARCQHRSLRRNPGARNAMLLS